MRPWHSLPKTIHSNKEKSQSRQSLVMANTSHFHAVSSILTECRVINKNINGKRGKNTCKLQSHTCIHLHTHTEALQHAESSFLYSLSGLSVQLVELNPSLVQSQYPRQSHSQDLSLPCFQPVSPSTHIYSLTWKPEAHIYICITIPSPITHVEHRKTLDISPKSLKWGSISMACMMSVCAVNTCWG